MSDLNPATASKIKDLDELAQILEQQRKLGRKIVHCHGVFDLMHLGHIRHFEAAKKHGDILVVTLTPDQWVNKGPTRPAFTVAHRAECIASLACVDYVAINRWPNAVQTIALLRPHFYAKGADYLDAAQDPTGGIQLEQNAVKEAGGQLLITDEIQFSSSSLINRQMSNLSKEANDFLVALRQKYSARQVLSYLEGARPLKVLVVGETIIDEYHYCQALGKSGKEPILAVRFISSEKFAGGILAVANHVAGFCDQVGLYSFLGSKESQELSQEDFIRAKLSPKIEPTFFYMKDAPTIVKRRFVENYPFQKMFEVYLMNEDEFEGPHSEQFRRALAENVAQFDLVIVTDYGHGMLDAAAIDILSRQSRCLAVNTQANAANHGFNTVSKYPHADYICVSEKEIRLEARQRKEDLRQIVEQVAAKLGCRRVMITRGQRGMLCYAKDEGFIEMPALADHFTDRVGAGDAVFAITSLCVAQKAPLDVLALVGNAVGAIAVNTIGNRDSVGYVALHKALGALLK
jgi:rfaE bifunctional protein kinase chain/domain/rfaE bifunctional protein nucleotidyltransferase chain/domain